MGSRSRQTTTALWTATPRSAARRATAAIRSADILRARAREVEPGRRRNEFEMVGEIAREGVRKHLVPFPVDCGHSTDVAREGAVIDETRECRLHESRRVPVADELRLVQGLPQRWRRHQETEPERRQHRLREGAHVDDPAFCVERLQRLEGTSSETELAVVVVFDDGCVVPLGPRQQRLPARQRQRDGERILMGRRDVDGPDSRAAARRRSALRDPPVRRPLEFPTP